LRIDLDTPQKASSRTCETATPGSTIWQNICETMKICSEKAVVFSHGIFFHSQSFSGCQAWNVQGRIQTARIGKSAFFILWAGLGLGDI